MNYKKKYNEALKRAKEIKEKIVYSHLSTESCKAVSEYIDTIIPELAENEDEKIRKEINILYSKIDNCISELLKARTDKDSEAEGMALFKMEGLMVATLQDLSCIEDYLEKQKEQPMSAEEVLIRAGLKPYRDGNQWCVLAGGNIQEGICGFGDTIDEALYQFLMEVLKIQKEQKPAARENDFVSKPKNSVEILKHYLTWATTEEENCPYSWKELADAIKDGIKALEEQKPAEWSEEDEIALGDLMWCIKQARESAKDENDMGNIWFAEKWLQNRLKSLRPSWKPSEEQMQYLLAVINDPNNIGAESCYMTIKSLYNDLKKL